MLKLKVGDKVVTKKDPFKTKTGIENWHGTITKIINDVELQTGSRDYIEMAFFELSLEKHLMGYDEVIRVIDLWQPLKK